MELKLLSLSEDDKLIRECMEQASAFYGCLGKMGVTEILCDRKKAQELGADCQITGIFTGGELTAFACAFEYTGLKRNGRKWLNPGDKEWRQIETLGTNVVVIPLLVGKEKVGRLIELLREQYRDSHLLFRISGEQSEKFQEDLAVVSEKNLKSHRYDAAGENVWLFHFAPQIRMEDTYFEEEILLILPGQEVLLEMGIEEAEVTMVKLTGYEIVRSEKGSAFFRKPGAACEGVLLQCDYEQLLRYQRFINLTNYEEHFEQTDRGKALIYSEKYQSDSSLLWNDLLREMVKTRKAEWSIVPDSYIMYPVTYKEQDRLLECACYDNQEIGNYMHYMDIRLQCETGVPFGKDGIDLMERYKNRLERIPLGRLRVRITLEMILDILDHEDQPVGCDAEAEAVLSIDRLSHIGVLTLVSLSTPFLLSHFLDNIVRNQLMVIEENGEAVNLYAYMQEQAEAFLEKYGEDAAWKVDTAFSGTRSDPSRRGMITGIGVENFHPGAMTVGVIRGILEELHDQYEQMCRLTGKKAIHLAGSGNGIRRNPLMRKMAEKMFGMPMDVAEYEEEAAYGAAVCAWNVIAEKQK